MRHDPAMDQAIGQTQAQSLALAEPTQHVRVRWIITLTLASLGMWMANQTPSQVMLALQLQDITPRHKIVALGAVTALNAISSALATPIVGALSDRTVPGRRLGRFGGRRHRWTLVMVLLAADLPGAAGQGGHGGGRGRAVVLVRRLSERRVRHLERGRPGPRAGPAASHGVRLGRNADRARPGPGLDPGGRGPQPGPVHRLYRAGGPDGGAGAAVRAVHPRLPARAGAPGAVLLAPGGLLPTGSARANTPISAGPG